MVVEGLTQPELADVLCSRPFTRALACVALHTEATCFEGGFVVGRDEAGFAQSATVLAQESGARSSFNNPYGYMEAGIVLPTLPRQVASFHSHPSYIAPLTAADFTNIEPSADDIMHMQRAQEHCLNYVAGITDLRTRSGLLLALHRATRPLPQDHDTLFEQYDQAMSGNFDAELEERLGIKTARVMFALIRGRIFPSRALSPRGRCKLDEAIAPLF